MLMGRTLLICLGAPRPAWTGFSGGPSLATCPSDEIRIGHQSEDGEGARPHDPASAAGARGRGDSGAEVIELIAGECPVSVRRNGRSGSTTVSLTPIAAAHGVITSFLARLAEGVSWGAFNETCCICGACRAAVRAGGRCLGTGNTADTDDHTRRPVACANLSIPSSAAIALIARSGQARAAISGSPSSLPIGRSGPDG